MDADCESGGMIWAGERVSIGIAMAALWLPFCPAAR